jgi:peptidoglycan hydrolase-like protein with peptidoglycan-binding domain
MRVGSTMFFSLALVAISVCGPVEAQISNQGNAAATGQGTAEMRKALQQAQQRLRRLGYDPGAADGVPGPKTVVALKRFQTDHGLAATGALDAKTSEALSSSAVSQDKKPVASTVAAKQETSTAAEPPASLVGKRYQTSESDIIFFLKDGDAAERNGHFGVLYARQAVSFDSNGRNPTTWCKYQQEKNKITLTCDSEVGEFTINKDGSLTGPPEGMWGHEAFARLTELK